MQIYLLVGAIYLAAGFTQGLTGFGSALLALPLLSLFIDIKTVVPLCMLNGLLITGYLCWQLRASLDRRRIMPLFAGSLPGIVIGAVFLKEADAGLLKVLLGGLIIAFAAWRLLVRPAPGKLAGFWGYAAGFATGAVGAAFSAGGPPAIIYTALTDWSKDVIKGTLSGFFFISGVLTAVVHAAAGLTTPAVLKFALLSAPFVLAGVYAGSHCYGRIDRERYLTAVLALLLVMGVILTITGFRLAAGG